MHDARGRMLKARWVGLWQRWRLSHYANFVLVDTTAGHASACVCALSVNLASAGTAKLS